MENKTKKFITIILAAVIAFLLVLTFTVKKNENNSNNVLPKEEQTTVEEPAELNENSIVTEDSNKKTGEEKVTTTTTIKKALSKNTVRKSKTEYTKELPASKASVDKKMETLVNQDEEALKSEPASKLVEVDKEINPNNSEIVKFRGVTYKIKIKPQSKEGINDNQTELN